LVLAAAIGSGAIGTGAKKEVIRVLRQDSTLECDLDETCKVAAHQPRHGIVSPDGKRIVYQHQENDDVIVSHGSYTESG
jgi:hypothetical protein